MRQVPRHARARYCSLNSFTGRSIFGHGVLQTVEIDVSISRLEDETPGKDDIATVEMRALIPPPSKPA